LLTLRGRKLNQQRILVKNVGFPLQNERALLPNYFNFLQANSKREGAGIFLHELQLYDSFHQKCSILDTFAAQGLKIQERD
jgi:hypothetical protein